MTTEHNALSTLIHQRIKQQGGRISFADFMALALYHPQYGYYMADAFALGKQGDFTTAAEMSSLYASCFAQQCQQVIKHLGMQTPQILELGAGSGRFAGDLLSALAKVNDSAVDYYIYEISPQLRQKQRELLSKKYPQLLDRVHWLDNLPKEFNGIIIANEVLDALPVNRFHIDQQQIYECCVATKNDDFIWHYTAPLTNELASQAQHLAEEYALPNDYESEINLQLAPFITSLTNALAQGIILFADYGYGQPEYYHPERKRGTLTCFHQHHHHDDPFLFVGAQDITAHVNFTQVIEIASAQQCQLAGYTTQAAFLLDCGLTQLLVEEEQHLSEADKYNVHQAIKMLTMPTEMGERIKIMALSKHCELPLRGFQLQDRRRDL